MKSGIDVVLVAQSSVTSLSLSNPMRLTIDGQAVTVQKARELCGLQPSSGGSAGVCSWEAGPTLNEAVLESLLTGAGFSCLSVRDTDPGHEALRAALLQRPAVVCISTTFICSKKHFEEIVRRIRSVHAGAFILAGGPLVTHSYHVCRSAGIDAPMRARLASTYLFMDDAEYADAYLYDPVYRGEEKLPLLVQRIIEGRSFDDIAGVIVHRNGVLRFPAGDVVTPCRTPPKVGWELLPQAFFSAGVVPLQASAGCPYSCSFCNFPKNANATSVKSDEELLNELLTVKARGARFVWFVDDNFRLGRRDLETFLPKLVKLDTGMQWMSLMRADLVRDLDLQLLRESGCREVCLGLESADDTVLKNMNKRAGVTMYADTVARLLDCGINCSVYFIIGFPGETSATVDRTLSFIREMGQCQTHAHLFWSIFPFMLMPGSPLFTPEYRDRFSLEGALTEWKHATMDSQEAYRHTLRLFGAIDDSGPVYRGDDLDLLDDLGFGKCREFYTLRQKLARDAAAGSKPDIPAMTATFRHIFQRQGA